jgi:hypothetical protein
MNTQQVRGAEEQNPEESVLSKRWRGWISPPYFRSHKIKAIIVGPHLKP